MYIEKIKIDKFRVLEDIEICFQAPNSATAHPETGNVVNVIAGVNGCGKTSLLEAIYDCGDGNHNGTKNAFWKGSQSIQKVFLVRATLPLMYEKSQEQELQDLTPLESYQKARDSSFSKKLPNNGILSAIEEWIKIFIVEQERKVFDADPKNRTKLAIKAFSKIFEGLIVSSQLVDLDSALNRNRPLFDNGLGSLVTIDQLSDGEKQLYGSVIRIIIENPTDSIILIDEPEIALHPAWQQKIMQIYSRIGKNNQFIVATHSPQIIASVPYQNRILLRKENGKIAPVHCSQPPSGLDVNSILSEIMGAEPRPPEVLELYRQYRQFVEERKENTPEALAVRAKLSEESDHSQFMQEMNFLIDMRDL